MKGVVFFAHNNEEIDYGKIAIASAYMVKRNLNVPITLITDTGTLRYTSSSYENHLSMFDQIITINHQDILIENNVRNYKDTVFHSKMLPFKNASRWQAYDLSPYEETLLLDVDYLVMSSYLNNFWNYDYDVMLPGSCIDLNSCRKELPEYLDDFGIRLYWATVVFFKKNEVAKQFFEIVRHVKENYQFYKDCYTFRHSLFRNDYAFSIATHMMNCYKDQNTTIRSLPPILKTLDNDDIYQISDVNNIILYTEKEDRQGEYMLSRVNGIDLHVMNKWALSRFADRIIEVYQ